MRPTEFLVVWRRNRLRTGRLHPKVFIGDRERVASIIEQRSHLPYLDVVIEVRPGTTVRGDVDWNTLLASEAEEFDYSTLPMDVDDDCTILYTSGTTGAPKGAVATHRSHMTTVSNFRLQVAVEAEMSTLRGDPVPAPLTHPTTLIPGPLFHVSYLPKIHLAPISGMQLVLMYKWDAQRAVELINSLDVDSFTGVPTVARQLMDTAAELGSTLPSLRSLTTGGAQTSTTSSAE